MCVVLTGALSASCTQVREYVEPWLPNAPPPAVPEGRSAPTPAAAYPLAPPVAAVGGAVIPAFPGAEGFGAFARGGRGGAVCRVRSLAHAGPGTLQACFDQPGPRTVVFDVSGTIEGPLEIKHGRLTIAGQTAPGPIAVRGGVVCDNVYDPNDCHDVIVRHLRLRGGAPDSLRLGGAHDVIVDHCSLASAEDENVEITRSRNVTVQYSVIAEPRGEHYRWGGVLINYSKDVMPLDAITLHHNAWNGVAGRLPEVSCEENGDGPGRSNCAGRTLSLELSNNVLWDASDPIWFNHCTGNNEGNDCAPNGRSVALRLNLVGNVMARRSNADPDAPLAEPSVFSHRGGSVYAYDNLLLRGAGRAAGSTGRATAGTRHPFPPLTYTPTSALVATLARKAGAFPRDRMDERLASYLGRGIDERPPAWRGGEGVFSADAFPGPVAAAPPADSDGDGVPDAWEHARGLNPSKPDGASIGLARGCAAGYSALECYINELADALVPR